MVLYFSILYGKGGLIELMIETWRDKETQIIFRGEEYDKKAEKQLPVEKWSKARTVLEALDAAESLNHIKRYEPDTKSGQFKDKTTLKISDQYRVVFEWNQRDAYDVFAGDPEYH